MSQNFTEEQKQYLQGFMAGVVQRGSPTFAGMTAAGAITADPAEAVRDLTEPQPGTVYGTPVEDLCKEERIKLEEDPLRIWERMLTQSEAGVFPAGGDVFRYKYHGLFHVAPAQDAYMLRCRIPGCALTAVQLKGLADLAERFGGGYADITTRGNIQIREIGPHDAVNVLTALYDLGLTSRGAGADNVRNITASPTSGFDPDELYDVLPLAKSLHHYILNSPDLYGLPRKFNVAFDNGGAISVAADTNDIGFMSARVGEGKAVPAGVYFRVILGGITGHGSFAQDCGVVVRPHETVAVAAAMIRVFIEHGDRTNRKKARLKYLLQGWGMDRFIRETERKLAFDMVQLPPEDCEPRRPIVRHGHIGVRRQAQADLNYVGVVIPVGRMQSDQMRQLANLATANGSGDIRLTVFQNLILADVPDEKLEDVRRGIVQAGFQHEASSVSGGLIACTGNTGCKYALTDTKGHAKALGRYLDNRISLDQPVNIHLTGCPHSCAQHYCGDIGLLGVKRKVGEDSREAYNVVLGGGMDQDQGIAQEVLKGVLAEDLPGVIERTLQAYSAGRQPGESFVQFTRRHEIEALKLMMEA